MEMKRRLHIPVCEQQVWLSQILRGHYGYFGVVGNHRSMEAFFTEVKSIWFKALRRRRQKAKMTWDRFLGVLTMFPLPNQATMEPSHEMNTTAEGYLSEEPGAVTPHAGI